MANEEREREGVVKPCPFCDIIGGRAHARVLRTWQDAWVIVPLNPVTNGHLLVVPCQHVTDALVDPSVTAMAMRRAAEVATGPCNIITSVGHAATQSVWHLHVHIVPRRRDDGLALPWGTNEEHMRQHDEAAYQFYNG